MDKWPQIAFPSNFPVRLSPLVIAFACTAWVLLDAYLSPRLPFPLFNYFLPETFPYKLTMYLLAVVVGIFLFWQAAKRTPRIEYFFIALLFAFAQMGGFKAGPLDGLDITTLVCFALILADRFLHPDKPLFSASLFFFAGALLLLDMINLMHNLSASHLLGLFGLFRTVLLAWVLVNLITDAATVRFAVTTFVVVALISAMIGISQGMLYLLFGIDFTLIDHFDASDTQYKPTPFGMLPRSSALNGSAQHLSSFLLIALPFVLSGWYVARGKKKLAMAIAIVVILGGVLSTWNYGAFFAVAFILLLYPFFQWPRHSIHIVLGLVLFVAVCYYTGILEWAYSVSLGNENVSKGVSQRHTLLALGLEKLINNPWFGTGLHGFADTTGNYWHRPVHDAYIQTATEIGIVGGLVFLVMLVTIITQAVLSSVHFKKGWSLLARASALSVVGLMWLMLTEPMLDHSNTWLILGLTQSILLVGWRYHWGDVITSAYDVKK